MCVCEFVVELSEARNRKSKVEKFARDDFFLLYTHVVKHNFTCGLVFVRKWVNIDLFFEMIRHFRCCNLRRSHNWYLAQLWWWWWCRPSSKSKVDRSVSPIPPFTAYSFLHGLLHNVYFYDDDGCTVTQSKCSRTYSLYIMFVEITTSLVQFLCRLNCFLFDEGDTRVLFAREFLQLFKRVLSVNKMLRQE